MPTSVLLWCVLLTVMWSRFQAQEQGLQRPFLSAIPSTVSGNQLFGRSTGGSQLFSSGLLNEALADKKTLPAVELGAACSENATCVQLANAHCINGSCQCLTSFVKDSQRLATGCKLAPGYSERCATTTTDDDGVCRAPFVCNDAGICDCPKGHIQEYFQCVMDCPAKHVPVGKECKPARDLGEPCDHADQCVQSYAQCLHNQCQCIAGANQRGNSCYPVNQCPLGNPAADTEGKPIKCKSDHKNTCPDEFYCLFPEFVDSFGFCCPKIKMNCPIGKALVGRNCSNCPWDTHHCFSYTIGAFTESMCCPNACPTSQPLQKSGKCHARAAFGGHCRIDGQCANVVGAICRPETKTNNSSEAAGREAVVKRCLCPTGNYQNYFGKCLKVSKLGDSCTRDEECQVGTNTVCRDNVCACYQGYMPEPPVDQPAQKCIAEPSCPTASGIQTVRKGYTDCSDDASVCDLKKQFCRKWWFDGNRTYSLCCPKPDLADYERVCRPFRMRLLLANQVGDGDAEPLRCDIAPIATPPTISFNSDTSTGPNATNPILTQPKVCPAGSSCLFDPFSLSGGVCCRAEKKETETVEAKVDKGAAVGTAGSSSVGGAEKRLPQLPSVSVVVDKQRRNVV